MSMASEALVDVVAERDQLRAQLQREREKVALAECPTLGIDDDESESAPSPDIVLLHQKLDEANVVRADLEARLAKAEEDAASLMSLLDEARKAEAKRVELEGKYMQVMHDLEEMRMQRDLDRSATPASPTKYPMNDPQPALELSELSEGELTNLRDQYDSRLRHLTAMKKDVERVLHGLNSTKHPDPDKPAIRTPESQNDDVTYDGLDRQWLQLVHWMRGRFTQKTSIKDLQRHIESFTPTRLRAPSPEGRRPPVAPCPSSSVSVASTPIPASVVRSRSASSHSSALRTPRSGGSGDVPRDDRGVDKVVPDDLSSTATTSHYLRRRYDEASELSSSGRQFECPADDDPRSPCDTASYRRIETDTHTLSARGPRPLLEARSEMRPAEEVFHTDDERVSRRRWRRGYEYERQDIHSKGYEYERQDIHSKGYEYERHERQEEFEGYDGYGGGRGHRRGSRADSVFGDSTILNDLRWGSDTDLPRRRSPSCSFTRTSRWLPDQAQRRHEERTTRFLSHSPRTTRTPSRHRLRTRSPAGSLRY